MNTFLAIAFTAIIGYLLGCISMGVIVSKAYARIDIRKYGSGNAGMTNVMRTLGWIPGAMAFAGDMLKGLRAALIGKWLYGEIGMCVGGLCANAGLGFLVLLKNTRRWKRNLALIGASYAISVLVGMVCNLILTGIL